MGSLAPQMHTCMHPLMLSSDTFLVVVGVVGVGPS